VGEVRVCSRCRETLPAGRVDPYCRECRKLYMRSYLAANRESLRRYNAAAMRKWRRGHPVAVRKQRNQYDSRRRARIRGNGWEPYDRDAIYVRDLGRCHLCRRPVLLEEFSIDHLIPISQGGPDSADNVATAHHLCNTRRGTKALESEEPPAGVIPAIAPLQ
jgi:5-methylcytosine-specific restriction endonuclease McrA